MRTNRPLGLLLVVIALIAAACGAAEDEPAAEAETVDGEDEIAADVEVSDEGEPVEIDLAAVVGEPWTLRFGGGPDGNIAAVGDQPITISFDDDGGFGGFGPCNEYSGAYEINLSEALLYQIVVDAQGCGEDLDAAEQAYLSALFDVDGINLSGGELALSGSATELIFERVAG